MSHIYLIAGEASGDLLGGRLMEALKTQQSSAIFSGIGGDNMAQAGIKSLFPMKELSLLGFLEIIPHIPKTLKRISQTVDDIIEKQPDIVVTIDAPAFTNRVIKQLKERTGRQFTCIHYVAPSVWAYKPKRAKKVAALYDHLLCLLPFEPAFFEPHGLNATFIGHSVVEETINPQPQLFIKQHNIPSDIPIIGIVPGSRSSELKRHLPILKQVADNLKTRLPNAHLVIPATSRFVERLSQETKNWALPCHVVTPAQKWHAMAACNIALIKSGTVSLEWARLGIPSIIFYRINPLSAWLLRRLIKIDHVNLINILEQKTALPELLQQECTAEKLTQEILALYQNDSPIQQQQAAMKSALCQLGDNRKDKPSSLAAKTILSLT